MDKSRGRGLAKGIFFVVVVVISGQFGRLFWPLKDIYWVLFTQYVAKAKKFLRVKDIFFRYIFVLTKSGGSRGSVAA